MRGQLVLLALFVVVLAIGCTIPTGELGGDGIQIVQPNETTNGTSGQFSEVTNETEDTGPQVIPPASDYYGCFSITDLNYNAYGYDHDNLNDEYFSLKNICNQSIDMDGWIIRDEYEILHGGGDHVYTFSNFVLPSQGEFILYTGCGVDTLTELYWCHTYGAIWNNLPEGDIISMRDQDYRMALSYSYPENRVVS